MLTPNEFWLQVHHLLEAYDAEGQTPGERVTRISDELLRSPPIVQRELLSELALLLARLADLYPTLRAEVNARRHEESQFPVG